MEKLLKMWRSLYRRVPNQTIYVTTRTLTPAQMKAMDAAFDGMERALDAMSEALDNPPRG